MLFNSYLFILFFLPVCILGYYAFNHFRRYALGQTYLLLMSLWFYAYFNVSYLFIILGSVAVNYGICLAFQKISRINVRKLILTAGLTVNIGVLLYYKYMDFFITNINALFRTEYALWGILLPLGISFFTFQQISFVVDSYRGEVPSYSFLYYASYVTFFPQLVAGPIVTYDELIPQFLDENRKRIDWEAMSAGIYIFVIGLAKKVLLADTFGNVVNWEYGHIEKLNSTSALIVMLAYTIQIYFDFSGYCDMAVGIGKMFHVDLPVNFRSPYQAILITDFWDRWHMTLTRFFRKYVYFPLGGSRKGEGRTYLNIMIVFLASGFWHGANWTFIFWGVCHGLFMVVTRRFLRFFQKIPTVINWFLTFVFVNVMWVFFRADSMKQAMQFLGRIVRWDFGRIRGSILSRFRPTEIEFLLQRLKIEVPPESPIFLIVFFLVSALIILGCRNVHEQTEQFKPSVLKLAVSAVLLVWCVFSFSGISTFLYFNF